MNEDWEHVVQDALERLKHDPNLEAADLFKTEAEVFNLRTMKTLSKLINDRFLDTLDFCVSTGKEANVFRGTTPNGDHIAVKIYRVNTRTFRSHMDYLLGDPRFNPQGKSNREVIELWAQKEFQNLRRFEDADLRVPEPITVKNNVILMEFIGDGQHIAPLLNDTKPPDLEDVLENLTGFIKTAWNDANLVHGDLSAYNVLMPPDEVVVIDTAQAVPRDHPRSRELLERDVKNTTQYFRKKGLDADPEPIVNDLLPPEASS